MREMSYYDRVLKLREEKHRTAFEFHFEDLFTEEEWKAATGKGWQERYGNYSIIPNLETFKHKIMKEEFA